MPGGGWSTPAPPGRRAGRRRERERGGGEPRPSYPTRPRRRAPRLPHIRPARAPFPALHTPRARSPMTTSCSAGAAVSTSAMVGGVVQKKGGGRERREREKGKPDPRRHTEVWPSLPPRFFSLSSRRTHAHLPAAMHTSALRAPAPPRPTPRSPGRRSGAAAAEGGTENEEREREGRGCHLSHVAGALTHTPRWGSKPRMTAGWGCARGPGTARSPGEGRRATPALCAGARMGCAASIEGQARAGRRLCGGVSRRARSHTPNAPAHPPLPLAGKVDPKTVEMMRKFSEQCAKR